MRSVINGPAPARRVTAVPLSAARARVLDFLEAQTEPITVGEVAVALGLHANGARLHLDGLVDAGLLIRERGMSSGRGRPPTRYRVDAAAPTDPRVREYAQLAAALATLVSQTSPDPTADARRAGAGWGASLASGRLPGTPRKARREIVGILAELGFDPAANDSATSVALRRCPLLEVARMHTEVVCQVHLGLVRGAMHEMGHDAPDSELLPFAEPGACRLLLTRHAGRS